ncbi:MAG: hypothetical protein HZC28_00270 [Spirochaetes bacterium]|nr:hypothetical protein [Spirochaetota bacterium]
MSDASLQTKIQELEKALKDKEQYISYLESLSEAHANVITLAQEERLEAEKVIQAHENIHGAGVIYDGESGDTDLREMGEQKITVNQSMHSILESGILLEDMVHGLMGLMKAKRGIVFLKTAEKKLAAKSLIDFPHEDMKKPYFEFPANVIRTAVKLKKTVVIKNKKLTIDGKEAQMSIIALPIIAENDILGILYTDTL